MSMTAMPPNQSPNDGPVGQPISRLDELLADRAVTGLGESEQAELCRLLTAAGKAEDTSLDLAAAACSQAFNPADRDIAIPASLAQEYIRKQTNRVLHYMDVYLVEIREWLEKRPTGEDAPPRRERTCPRTRSPSRISRPAIERSSNDSQDLCRRRS